MRKISFLIGCVVVLVSGRPAMSLTTGDSTWQLKVIPRANSAGYFPFTGALLNRNTNVDMNIVFQRKVVGVLAFKSTDLKDGSSDINYLQAAVFREVPAGKHVRAVLYAGYLFAQTRQFHDRRGSDYFGALAFLCHVNKRWRIETITLVNDPRTAVKAVNRLLLIHTVRRLRFDLSLHQRYVFKDAGITASGAVAAHLLRLKVFGHIPVQPTVTYQHYLTAQRPSFAMKGGIFFSLALPFDFPMGK